ncbi:MAG: beta-galactosidase [Clostridia bacterium]|nr:beta-galactosidase [Clostridia bacterium]
MRTRTLLTRATFAKPGEAFAPVTIPHTWNAFDGQDGGNDYFRAECTYRIPLPNPTKGKRQYLEFTGANHKATVYLGEKEIGSHEGGFSTFRFDLTEYLAATDNVVTVKVSNEKSHIYPQRADFTFYGGIYRPAYLIEVDEPHFDLEKCGTSGVFVTPNQTGRTRIDVFPVNAEGCMLQLRLLDAEGSAVAETLLPAEAHSVWETVVKNPHLWNGMADPYLYRVEATLLKDGEAVDQITERYGYRSYHIDPQNGFFLNGKSLPLRGVCRHQDRQDMGWAITEKEHREDFEMILEVGANTIRLAHYQHASFFYDLCDEAGLCIWAEIPFISEFMSGKAAHDNTLSQMTELIAQNYNRPSIIVWGIGNEITIGAECDDIYLNLCDLNALCKKLDPSRPTVMAQLARVPYDHPHNCVTDVVSYNNYYGWYVGTLEDNGPKMDEFHALYPDKAYGISEYGADNLITWHSASPYGHDYTEEYACKYHHHMLKCFEERPWIWATHMWNMFEFAADQRNEGGIKGRNCKGLVTYDRKVKKDTFFLYQAYWSKKPMVHVAGRRFTDRAPEERNVTVYTNASSVTLLLNGKELATLPVTDHAAIFENVPLQDGENTVTARTAEAEDTITLNGVAQSNPAYVLPDIAEALQAGNWFLETDEETDWGDEGYSLNDKIKVLATNEECLKILRGWIISLESLDISRRLHCCNRVGNSWPNGPAGEKTPLEMNSFKSCTKEEFAVLEKKLRSVKKA